MAAYAAKFLERRGVVIVTGERIESPAPSDTFAEPGEARTTSGKCVGYDVIFWCIGGRPNTDYLHAHFFEHLDADGRVRVTPQLRVEGEELRARRHHQPQGKQDGAPHQRPSPGR